MDFQPGNNQTNQQPNMTTGGPYGPQPQSTGPSIDFVKPTSVYPEQQTSQFVQPSVPQYDNMGVPIVDPALLQTQEENKGQAQFTQNSQFAGANAPGTSLVPGLQSNFESYNQTQQQMSQVQAQSAPKAKGPLTVLGVVILLLGIITGVLVLAMPKSQSSKPQKSTSGNTQPAKQSDDKSQSGDKNSDASTPYSWTVTQQKKNLQNLLTAVTTYKAQDTKHRLSPATPNGWKMLKADTIIDPVTNKPYTFTSNKQPNIGEVQYALNGVCSSDTTIIPSTDVGSFALRTKLYDGNFACVDASNTK